jgi:hypothetical protein
VKIIGERIKKYIVRKMMVLLLPHNIVRETDELYV